MNSIMLRFNAILLGFNAIALRLRTRQVAPGVRQEPGSVLEQFSAGPVHFESSDLRPFARCGLSSYKAQNGSRAAASSNLSIACWKCRPLSVHPGQSAAVAIAPAFNPARESGVSPELGYASADGRFIAHSGNQPISAVHDIFIVSRDIIVPWRFLRSETFQVAAQTCPPPS